MKQMASKCFEKIKALKKEHRHHRRGCHKAVPVLTAQAMDVHIFVYNTMWVF